MTNAELAILSLVAEEPRHGYDIEQVIDARGMRDWTEIGFSSIYYLLNKLEQAGRIESHTEPSPGRGPGRKVYQITPAGQKALQTAVEEALSTPGRCYLPVQLGLANLYILTPDRGLQALQQYRAGLQERQAYVKARWESQSELPYFVDAMFEHSLALIQAELGWIERFINQLQSQENENDGRQ